MASRLSISGGDGSVAAGPAGSVFSSSGRCLQQNQQESAGAAAERSGSQTRVQVCAAAP